MRFMTLATARALAGRAAQNMRTSMESLLRALIDGEIPFQGDVVVGSFAGTGATTVLDLGFVPDHATFLNDTDRNIRTIWFNGMTAGTAIQEGVYTNFHAVANTVDTLDSNGVKGLTLYSAVSQNGKVIRYTATRNKITG